MGQIQRAHSCYEEHIMWCVFQKALVSDESRRSCCVSSIYGNSNAIGETFAHPPTSRHRLLFKHSVVLKLFRWTACVRETWHSVCVPDIMRGRLDGKEYVSIWVFIWVAPFPLISLSLQHLLFILLLLYTQLHYLSAATVSLAFPLFQSLPVFPGYGDIPLASPCWDLDCKTEDLDLSCFKNQSACLCEKKVSWSGIFQFRS